MLRGGQRPLAILRKAAVNGMFWCMHMLFKNGIKPDTDAKMPSLTAAPVTVPLHQKQTSADEALGLQWKNWTVAEYDVSNNHYIRYI